jgi:predicted RNA binding protein YcfA (HicA-like mRNA interferase family)
VFDLGDATEPVNVNGLKTIGREGYVSERQKGAHHFLNALINPCKCTVVFLGTNSALSIPSRSKNTIIITLMLDLE